MQKYNNQGEVVDSRESETELEKLTHSQIEIHSQYKQMEVLE